jgi:hypothetical protein
MKLTEVGRKKNHQEKRKSVRVEDELFIENVFYIHPLTCLEVPDHTVGLLAVRRKGRAAYSVILILRLAKIFIDLERTN